MGKTAGWSQCTSPEHDAAHLAALCRVAAESHDPDTNNAAGVAARPARAFLDGVLFSGDAANWIPDRIMPNPDRRRRPAKYDWIIHAEIAALLAAGNDAAGGTLYALWAACPTCATAIVEAGIDRVVTLKKTQDATPERWREKVATGIRILKAGGVTVSFFAGKLDASIRFDGKELEL